MRQRMGRTTGVLLAAVLGLLLAGCTAADDSAADGATAAATPDPTDAPSPAATPSPTAAATADASATAPDEQSAGELAAALADGEVLVASDRGVDLVQGEAAQALTSIPASRAYADGAGGVVFQGIAPPQDAAPSAAIMWLPPDGGDAVTVVPDGAADVVTLHDAAVIDGEPTAVYTARTGDTPETAEERLMLLALPDGDARKIAVTGGWESGASSISSGGDLLAVAMSAEASTWFTFLDLSGEPVDVDANPLPEDEACTGVECPTAMTVGDTGDRIAWATGGTITTADLDSGERSTYSLSDLPPDAFVEGLDLLGDRLAIAAARPPGQGDDATTAPTLTSVIVLDLGSADGEPSEVTPAGFPSLVGG